MVVWTALFETGHNYFKMHQTITPVWAVLIELMETIPAEFPTELAELGRPTIVQYSCELALAHDRDTVSILKYLSWGLMNESNVYSHPKWFFL